MLLLQLAVKLHLTSCNLDSVQTALSFGCLAHGYVCKVMHVQKHLLLDEQCCLQLRLKAVPATN